MIGKRKTEARPCNDGIWEEGCCWYWIQVGREVPLSLRPSSRQVKSRYGDEKARAWPKTAPSGKVRLFI
jgi:hypothetical protein